MRQSRFLGDGRQRGAGSALVGLLAFVLLASTGLPWSRVAATHDGAPSVATGVFSGMFVAGAGLAALVSLRRHVDVGAGWSAATGALVAAQALLVTLPIVTHTPQSVVEVVVIGVGALIGTFLVAGALLQLRRVSYVVDDSFAVGLGMALVASGNLLVLVPLSAPVERGTVAPMVLLVATHLVTAGVVLGLGVLPLRTAWLVAATALVVASALALVTTGSDGPVVGVVVTTALAVVGAAWIAAAWGCVHDALHRSPEPPRREPVTLSATTRAERERLHELRSTVAGLVNGSALLEHADIDEASRTRIWGSVRRELDRMQRMLSPEQQEAAQIDLDEALALMRDLQGLKGRRVELRSSGELVRARPDALAEVVNILMDNAATHGGSDDSLIEVVRRDEETVDITVTDFGRGIAAEDREGIFEWGRRGPDSPGEGIGLHVAQRLVAEDGGSLRLVEASGTGSSFMISLPSPRRSTEDTGQVPSADFPLTSKHHVSDLGEEGHVPWRRPS